MSHYILCLVTIDDAEKAAEIARNLVQNRIAACANIIPEIRSIYQWKGEICDDAEKLILIKTTRDKYEALESAVKRLHPYEVPEVVAFDIDSGLSDYLKWIDDCTA
jgi:periplasmic divalent cation tolerance protein